MKTYFIPNWRFIVLAILALFLIAAQGDIPDLTDLNAVLVWLVAGGSVAAAQWVLSTLAELWPGWHGLPSRLKFAIGLLLPVGLSLGSNALLGYPDFIAGVSPTWAIVVTALLGWYAGQSAMTRANMTGYNAKAKAKVRK